MNGYRQIKMQIKEEFTHQVYVSLIQSWRGTLTISKTEIVLFFYVSLQQYATAPFLY